MKIRGYKDRILQLIKSDGFRASVLMSGGNIFGSGMSAVAMLLVSRNLGPEKFGIFSALFSLLLLVSRLVDVGINLATQRALAKSADHDRRQTEAILVQTLWIKLLTIAGLCLISFLIARPIAHSWLHIDDVTLVRNSLIFAGITLIYEFYISTIQAFHKFSQAAWIAIWQGILKFGSIAVLLLSGKLSVNWAFYVYALAPGAVLINALKNIPTIPSLDIDKKVMRQIFRTATWTGIAVASAALADNIDVLLIQKYLTSYETGLYAAGSRITTFVNLISLSLIAVLSVRVARYHQIEHLQKYLRKAKWMALGGLLGTLLLIPLAGVMITLTVGNAYQGGLMALAWQLTATAISTATGPFAALFYLFDRPQYYAASGLLLMLTLIGMDLWLIPVWGIDGAGVAKVVARIVVLGYTLYSAYGAYQTHYARHTKKL